MNSLKVYIIGKTSKFLKSMRPFSIKNWMLLFKKLTWLVMI
jgi:hypothetical protein